MKTSLEPFEAKKTDPMYPALYQSIAHGTVVLFVNVREGTVVHRRSGGLDFKTGDHSSNWEDCTDSLVWVRLTNGHKITLENS